MSEHKQVIYAASCTTCDQLVTFTNYHDRADWVGKHRVKTGHPVGVWIAVDPA